jgi:hypothetical protein
MLNVKQKGLSPVGVLFVVCTFAFILMVGLKLFEHYVDYNTIRSSYKELAEKPEFMSMGANDKFDAISSALTLNNIREWDYREHTYFNNSDGEKVLGFAYEQRVHMFANIDVVLVFNYESESE